MPRLSLNVAGSLERAVRPFAADPPRPRQARPEPVQDDGAAVLEWSCKTNVEATTIEGLGFKVSWASEQVETSRVTDTVQVGPVTVERIKNVTFRSSGGKRSRYRFNN